MTAWTAPGPSSIVSSRRASGNSRAGFAVSVTCATLASEQPECHPRGGPRCVRLSRHATRSTGALIGVVHTSSCPLGDASLRSRPACRFPPGASAGQADQRWISLAASTAVSRRSARRPGRPWRVYSPCMARRISAAARRRGSDVPPLAIRPQVSLTPSPRGADWRPSTAALREGHHGHRLAALSPWAPAR